MTIRLLSIPKSLHVGSENSEQIPNTTAMRTMEALRGNVQKAVFPTQKSGHSMDLAWSYFMLLQILRNEHPQD